MPVKRDTFQWTQNVPWQAILTPQNTLCVSEYLGRQHANRCLNSLNTNLHNAHCSSMGGAPRAVDICQPREECALTPATVA